MCYLCQTSCQKDGSKEESGPSRQFIKLKSFIIIIIIIINFTADTANNFPKSFKVSAILNTPQVYLKWKLV